MGPKWPSWVDPGARNLGVAPESCHLPTCTQGWGSGVIRATALPTFPLTPQLSKYLTLPGSPEPSLLRLWAPLTECGSHPWGAQSQPQVPRPQGPRPQAPSPPARALHPSPRAAAAKRAARGTLGGNRRGGVSSRVGPAHQVGYKEPPGRRSPPSRRQERTPPCRRPSPWSWGTGTSAG